MKTSKLKRHFKNPYLFKSNFNEKFFTIKDEDFLCNYKEALENKQIKKVKEWLPSIVENFVVVSVLLIF